MRHPAHYIFALAFFLAAQLCIRWNNLLTVRMIKAVNARRPPEDQLPTSFTNRRQTKLVEAEYHRLYPESRLPVWISVSLILGFACFLLTGFAFFKPSR